MEPKNINDLIESIVKSNDIEVADIPCVDLYMDQVTSFFESKLEDRRRYKDDKILTKTMINNYTKAKILMPAKNKKYSKEHMLMLTLIYSLKQVISINDIDMLFSLILNEKGEIKDGADIEEIYKGFLNIKRKEEEEVSAALRSKLKLAAEEAEGMESENKELLEMFLTVTSLINSADKEKRLAEKIIDNYFMKEKKK